MPSTRYTTIHVTHEDIDRATRNESAKCVVATALHRSIEGARRVSIDLQTIRFTVGDERFIYLTPPAASGYVVRFDAGQELHPFGFRLSEDHRVSNRQDRHSEASKARSRTRAAAKTAEAKAEKARAAIEHQSDPIDRALAETTAVAAERDAKLAAQALAETTAALAGQPHIEPDLTPDPENGRRKRKAPPRAYGRARREYGQRSLRINQAEDTPEHRKAVDSVTAAYDVYDESDSQ